MGLPYSGINTTYNTSGVIGSADTDILVSLKEGHHRPTQQWVETLRPKLNSEFPGVMFYFLPADMITQILNFGLPAPMDVQVEGADLEGNRSSPISFSARSVRCPAWSICEFSSPSISRSCTSRWIAPKPSRPVSLRSISRAACWCRSAAVFKPRPRST